jgi:hypothetical protein
MKTITGKIDADRFAAERIGAVARNFEMRQKSSMPLPPGSSTIVISAALPTAIEPVLSPIPNATPHRSGVRVLRRDDFDAVYGFDEFMRDVDRALGRSAVGQDHLSAQNQAVSRSGNVRAASQKARFRRR